MGLLHDLGPKCHRRVSVTQSTCLPLVMKAKRAMGLISDVDTDAGPLSQLTNQTPRVLLQVAAVPGTAVPVNTTNTTAIIENHKAHITTHSNTIKKRPAVAFAFDIDGVLVRGKQALPGASAALQTLIDNDVPFILLTNGGGKTEDDHAALLSRRLDDVPLSGDQFVQSHTPFRALVPRYANETVLVLGGSGDNIRNVAHHYGFRRVVTSSDVFRRAEHIHPFPEMTRQHHEDHGRSGSASESEEPLRIAAVLVFSSPRDWCLDLQVLVDVLLSSGGVLGTRSPLNGNDSLPNYGYQQDGQPTLYFCNPDFEWPTQHPQPRLAQGAFREALRGIWACATGGKAKLLFEVCGKPTTATYAYAEETLWGYARDTMMEKGEDAPEIKTVYMVGDNPESDIRGANGYVSARGAQWKSILVESGMYAAGSEPSYKPDYTVAGVGEAVALALEIERGKLEDKKGVIEVGNRVADMVIQDDKKKVDGITVAVQEVGEDDSDTDGPDVPTVVSVVEMAAPLKVLPAVVVVETPVCVVAD